MPKPDLHFLKSTDKVGFTPAGVTSFSKASSSSAIVRELIQNALDASQAAGNRKAIVRFCLGTIKTSDIPGIESYKRTLTKAKNARRKGKGEKLNNQEQMIVDCMEEELDKQTLPMLSIIDNGIGLTESTMRALLADGISEKSGISGGAFGNGHFAVFPISNLRYLLYAAINDSGSISSGHTILASQSGCSANGYYISGTTEEDEHCYPTGRSVPKVIRGILKDIKKNYGHGTVVLVPGFNNFHGSKTNLYDIIAEAATCNFFPAIEQKKLVVMLKQQRSSEEQKIDHTNLQRTLNSFIEKKRNRNFLSGHKANTAYRAMDEGVQYEIPILGGKVGVRLQTPSPEGRTRTNLFRNGMWITNSDKSSGGLPGFYNVFGGHQSFESVLLVTAKDAPKFHDLIRNSETPLHNQIDIRSMPKHDKDTLKECFELLRDWLKAEVPEISKEGYRPAHLLGVATVGNGAAPSKLASWHYQGSITPMMLNYQGRGLSRKEASGGQLGSAAGKNRRGKKPTVIRKVLPNAFDVVARPTREKGKEGKRICIRCHEDCRDMVLRLIVDENSDSTTDDHVWKQYEAKIISARDISVPSRKGNPSSHLDIVTKPHSGVRLGDLEANQDMIIHVEYKLDGIPKAPMASISMRVKLERFLPKEGNGNDTTG